LGTDTFSALGKGCLSPITAAAARENGDRENGDRHDSASSHPCCGRKSSQSPFSARPPSIRIALGIVRGLSRRLIDRIRAQRPFASLADFLDRAHPTFPEVETLILCGGFGFTGQSRPALVWELHTRRKDSGYYTGPLRGNVPALPAYSASQRAAFEMEILGCSVSAHPVALVRNGSRNGFLASGRLPQMCGRKVRLLGILDAVRRTGSKRGGTMAFATFEDEQGVFEATLFPRTYARFGRLLGDCGPFVVEGKVESRYDALSITLDNLTLFEK
jgi:DNA polymerase III alpha subunit